VVKTTMSTSVEITPDANTVMRRYPDPSTNSSVLNPDVLKRFEREDEECSWELERLTPPTVFRGDPAFHHENGLSLRTPILGRTQALTPNAAPEKACNVRLAGSDSRYSKRVAESFTGKACHIWERLNQKEK